MVHQHVNNYFSELSETVGKLPAQDVDTVIAILLESARHRRKVFVCGNGGSASTASHISCDLAKNTMVTGAPRLRVVGLTDNTPMMTAWANDTGYDNVFAAQLIPLIEPGDVLIGISSSGNSHQRYQRRGGCPPAWSHHHRFYRKRGGAVG
jgi:D-sedoheptulose 7-phosphate isomerase